MLDPLVDVLNRDQALQNTGLVDQRKFLVGAGGEPLRAELVPTGAVTRPSAVMNSVTGWPSGSVRKRMCDW